MQSFPFQSVQSRAFHANSATEERVLIGLKNVGPIRRERTEQGSVGGGVGVGVLEVAVRDGGGDPWRDVDGSAVRHRRVVHEVALDHLHPRRQVWGERGRSVCVCVCVCVCVSVHAQCVCVCVCVCTRSVCVCPLHRSGWCVCVVVVCVHPFTGQVRVADVCVCVCVCASVCLCEVCLCVRVCVCVCARALLPSPDGSV